MANESIGTSTLTVRFDDSLNVGSRPEYGRVRINVQGVERTIGGEGSPNEISISGIQNGTTVSLEEYGYANGFTYNGWIFPASGDSYTVPSNYVSRTINGDMLVVPLFKPDSVTFSNRVTLTVSGLDDAISGQLHASDPIVVSSMLDYYHYSLRDTINDRYDSTYQFNVVSGGYTLPDGKDITLNLIRVAGYTISVSSNGISHTPVNSDGETGNDIGTGQTSGTNDRGGELVSGSLSQVSYETFNIHNTSGTLSINVEYVQDTPTGTVYVKSEPSDGGTVSILNAQSDTQQYTGQYGEQVTITATQRQGYQFTNWMVSTDNLNWNTVQSSSVTYTFNISEPNCWYKAVFKQMSSPKISVMSHGDLGTVTVTHDGIDVTNQQPLDSLEYGIGATFDISATPNTGFVFDHWSKSTESGWSSQDPRMEIGFESTSVTYVAHFRQNILAEVGSYTSTSERGDIKLGDGNDASVQFKLSYTDENRQSQMVVVDTSTTIVNPLIENGEVTLDIETPRQTYGVENHRKYRYTIVQDSVKWSDEQIAPGTPFDGNDWTTVQAIQTQNMVYANFAIPVSSATVSIPRTVTVVYEKVELFDVSARVLVINNQSGSHSDISVSGSGTYDIGSSVALSTIVNPASARIYEFLGWFYESDLENAISTNTHFTIDYLREDTDIVAVYKEYGILTYSAQPSELCQTIEAEMSQSATPIVSGVTTIPFGTEVTITVTPASGASVYNWMGASSTSPSIGTATIVSTNQTVTAYLRETFNTLTVNVGDGGMVSIDERTPGGQYVPLEPNNGAYEIPSGSGFRATAMADPRYRFGKYRLFDHHSTLVDESVVGVYDYYPMTDDMTLEVSFTYFQWLTTLSTIIKVY